MEDENVIDGKTLSKFRIMFIGNSSVGKTSLIHQYINNSFRKEYFPTCDIV